MRNRSPLATISGAPNRSTASAMQSETRAWQELKNSRASNAARWCAGTCDLNSMLAFIGSLFRPDGQRHHHERGKRACRALRTDRRLAKYLDRRDKMTIVELMHQSVEADYFPPLSCDSVAVDQTNTYVVWRLPSA